MNIITINCNGLREPLKIDYLKSILKDRNIDICLIQETHLDNFRLCSFVERQLNAKCYWSLTDNSHSKGVGIIIKNPEIDVTHFSYDYFGRYCCVDIKLNDFELRIVSIYAPNNPLERKTFFDEIYHIFLGTKPILFGGDFNCVDDLELDKMGGNRNRGNDGLVQLNNITHDFSLIDCFRKKYPHTKEFTWSSQGVSCRLDRFYISSFLNLDVNFVKHDMYTFSDHHMVCLTISPTNIPRNGRSYWKFNSTLLKDLDFIDYMKMFLTNNSHNIPDDNSFLEWWDNFKQQIKSVIITFSKNKKRRERFLLNAYREEFIELERNGNINDANLVKDKIKSIEAESLKGAQIRSRALYLEGEKPSKYFLAKELNNNKKKCIKSILDDNGNELNESNDILESFKCYYTNLFKFEPVDTDKIDDLLTNLPVIDDDDKQFLNKDITTDEIISSLESFQSNKSPGSDGLSKEFYLTFIDSFLPLFTRLFKAIFTSGTLSETQKLSYISLLCKNESDPKLMSSYRPISLLNVDYKILTKLLSRRLEKCLEKIVHIDQTCAVPNRSILDNCHLIRDIIEYANQKNINAILLSVDQEKAFDRVSHFYMLRVLDAFGLGQNFVKWISIIYSDITSSVIVNHFISDKFPVLRSVRQGCCLSPLLYILCLEPILRKIRNDANVQGFQIPGKKEQQKIIAFADDGNFSLSNEKSVETVLKHFEFFELASGSKLNKTKTKGMFLGKWKTRSDHPFGISWVKKMKIFGILFGNVTDGDIWDPMLNKIKKALNFYKTRTLSLFGKSCIVNCMVLSKLWYVSTTQCVPDKYIDLIEKEIFNFIWNGKMELLSRNTCFFPKESGGISLNDIRMKIASLQLSQISKIVYNSDLSWVHFGHFWLGINLKKFADYDFSNNTPHCIEDLPIYYGSLRNTLNFINKIDSDIVPSKGARCKFFYDQILDSFVKLNGTNVQKKFPQIDFSTVFKNVTDTCIDPLCINVTFKLAHYVLPVADRLYNFGIQIDRLCTFCKRENETMEHLFLYCTHVQWSKKFLASWIKNVCNCGINADMMIFSYFDKKISKYNLKTALIILSEYRNCIWMIRNKMRYDRKIHTPFDIASLFIKRIKYRMYIDFNRLDYLSFQNLWLHDTLCEIDDENLIYCFTL